MSELDKKLEEAWEGYIDDGGNTNYIGMVEQTKKVFVDNGWVKLRNHEPAEKCYTGEEWYGKFMYEIGHGGFISWSGHTKSTVIEAAKKASGLNNPSEGEKG